MSFVSASNFGLIVWEVFRLPFVEIKPFVAGWETHHTARSQFKLFHFKESEAEGGDALYYYLIAEKLALAIKESDI